MATRHPSEPLSGQEFLETLLSYEREPGRYPRALRQPALLHRHILLLLELCLGKNPANLCLETSQLPDAKRAAAYFLRNVVLAPQADHYLLLGLEHSFSPEQLKSHYRAWMRLTHPDRASVSDLQWPSDTATRINQAHATLSDAALRTSYDAQRQTTRPDARPVSPRHRTPTPHHPIRREQSQRQRRLFLALAASLSLIVAGLTWWIWHDPIPHAGTASVPLPPPLAELRQRTSPATPTPNEATKPALEHVATTAPEHAPLPPSSKHASLVSAPLLSTPALTSAAAPKPAVAPNPAAQQTPNPYSASEPPMPRATSSPLAPTPALSVHALKMRADLELPPLATPPSGTAPLPQPVSRNLFPGTEEAKAQMNRLTAALRSGQELQVLRALPPHLRQTSGAQLFLETYRHLVGESPPLQLASNLVRPVQESPQSLLMDIQTRLQRPGPEAETVELHWKLGFVREQDRVVMSQLFVGAE